MTYVTVSAKTHLVRTSMRIEKSKLKIIRKIMHATRKNMQVSIGQRRKIQID